MLQGQIKVMQLDLADLASVKKFSKAYLAEERGPDLLILNAGVMACPQSYTKDGFEMQIGKVHIMCMKIMVTAAACIWVTSCCIKDQTLILRSTLSLALSCAPSEPARESYEERSFLCCRY